MKLVGDVIDEIAMEPFGSNIKVDCFVPTGVPVLNGSNLIGFVLNEDKFNYVTPEKAASLNKAVTSRGDVIVTHRGTLGQITYIPADSKYDKYVISQSQFRVRCKKDEMLPEFMVYFFHSREGQHQLLSNSSQVGVPALARPSSTFRKLKIPVPAIKEQRIIVDALTILNDKITSNKAINHHLTETTSATDNSPDIKRGNSVSRRAARRADSTLFACICKNIGLMLSSKLARISSLGSKISKALRTTVVMLGTAEPTFIPVKSRPRMMKYTNFATLGRVICV